VNDWGLDRFLRVVIPALFLGTGAWLMAHSHHVHPLSWYEFVNKLGSLHTYLSLGVVFWSMVIIAILVCVTVYKKGAMTLPRLIWNLFFNVVVAALLLAYCMLSIQPVKQVSYAGPCTTDKAICRVHYALKS
jgi:hypothetical protein